MYKNALSSGDRVPQTPCRSFAPGLH